MVSKEPDIRAAEIKDQLKSIRSKSPETTTSDTCNSSSYQDVAHASILLQNEVKCINVFK